VALGQVGTFSGVAGPIIGSARTMLAAWAQDLNSRGGLACHPIRLYSQDDGGDPGRAAALANALVADHHIAAFVASLTLGMAGFRPAVDALAVPSVGGGGTTAEYTSPWFFPDGASVDDQGIGLIRQGVELGHKRIGFLYCVESTVCTDYDKRMRAGMAAQGGGQLVYDAPISISQPDYTAQCINARDAKVDLLLLGMDGASIGRVARSCDAVRYRPLLATSAAVLSPGQGDDPLLRRFGVATTSAEAPWMLTGTPGLAEMHRVLAGYAPNVIVAGATTLSFASARLLEAAIRHVDAQARRGLITAVLVLEGLGTIRRETLDGLTGPLTFRPGQKAAVSSGCIFYERLTPDGWTAPRGARPVCLR
jgi:branched-chain amino acid transport system substrate-binding protein